MRFAYSSEGSHYEDVPSNVPNSGSATCTDAAMHARKARTYELACIANGRLAIDEVYQDSATTGTDRRAGKASSVVPDTAKLPNDVNVTCAAQRRVFLARPGNARRPLAAVSASPLSNRPSAPSGSGRLACHLIST